MIIAIDFDGTVVTHDFPLVGKDIGAVPVLKLLVENGHKLILWTMRSNAKEVFSNDENIYKVPSCYLTDAVNWYKNNEIPLFENNCNTLI